MTRDRDPGDAVPSGVAPQEPATPAPNDEAARTKLDELGPTSPAERNPEANAENDRQVASITRTVQPHGGAPSRKGVTGSGSGADGEGL